MSIPKLTLTYPEIVLFREPDVMETWMLEELLIGRLSFLTVLGCMKLSLLPLPMRALTFTLLITRQVVDFPRLGMGLAFDSVTAAETLPSSVGLSWPSHKS